LPEALVSEIDPLPLELPSEIELPRPDALEILERLSPKPSLPPRIGINGFDRIGRLIFRSAVEAGYDIAAVNDPFIPVHAMVYGLKFDMSHSSWKSKKKELQVREGPVGQLIVNGKAVAVLTEKDAKKIPWEIVGVNFVIETNLALNTFNDARNHFRTVDQASNGLPLLDQEKEKPLYYGVEKVLIASPSPDAKSIALGVNDSTEVLNSKILSHASAPVSALATVLKVINSKFGIRFCSFTLLKAVMGASRDIKCPNMGPSTHARSEKWDFGENLVPCQAPELEQAVFKILPDMRGKLSGMQVYTPVPEVSMFDLTLSLETESKEIFRDVCLEIKDCSQRTHRGIIKYVMKMSNENSASCVFRGSQETVVFDARSGAQIDQRTVKLVLWFDNETGCAARMVDVIRKYTVYQKTLP